MNRVRTAALLSLLAVPLHAQRATWIPIDDPAMPMLEQLILRGDIPDPSPQVRPLRLGEVIVALRASTCTAKSWCGRTVATLLDRWQATGTRTVHVDARVGAQGETSARRNLLWPAGDGRPVEGFAVANVAAQTGIAFAQLDGTYDPRAARDPDRGGASFGTVRLANGALGVAVPEGGVSLQMLSRNWGPPDAEGAARSSSGYPEPAVAIDLGGRSVHVSFVAGKLDDTLAADSAPDRRWLGMHRLDIRPSRAFAIGVWEIAVAQGERRSADDAWYGLFNTLAFDQLFGRTQQRNSVIGADLTWQRARVRYEGQFALDDWTSRAPARYAFTLGAGGALGASASWQLLWSRVSALAYRTSDPREDLLYEGVGLGPIFPDHDLWRVVIGIPLSSAVLVRPEVAYLVQGESALQSPFPGYDSLPAATGFLQGTVARTFRAGVRADGRVGPIVFSTDAGINLDRNADHVSGATRARFEGRFQVTVGGSHDWSAP